MKNERALFVGWDKEEEEIYFLADGCYEIKETLKENGYTWNGSEWAKRVKFAGQNLLDLIGNEIKRVHPARKNLLHIDEILIRMTNAQK